MKVRRKRIIIREFACLIFVMEKPVSTRCAHENALIHVLAVPKCPQNFAAVYFPPGGRGGSSASRRSEQPDGFGECGIFAKRTDFRFLIFGLSLDLQMAMDDCAALDHSPKRENVRS